MGRRERHEEETRGGVGTIARPASQVRQRPVRGQDPTTVEPAPRRAKPGRPDRPVPPPQRPGRGQRAVAVPRSAQPQQTGVRQRPVPSAVPNAKPAPGATWPTAPAAASPAGESDAAQAADYSAVHSRAGSHRAPFVVLLCCLLGGALVCALVISTTLAAGSFRITNLQQTTNALARQRQALEEQVAQAQSAQTIETEALKLGMRQAGELRFIDLKTGKTSTDAGTGWENAINVPGYTP